MPHAENYHPGEVERHLHARNLKHLRARKHGAAVVVESGPDERPWKHFRIRRDTVHLWRLDMARGERWEKTPLRGTLEELIDMVIDQFPWTLTDVLGNPERTSDPEY